MDRATQLAIVRLADLADQCERETNLPGVVILSHAIRHLAYPDRDVYPKRRGQRKTDIRRLRSYNQSR